MSRILPLLLLLPVTAMAQVSVNSDALDQLKPSPPKAPAAAEHKTAPHHTVHRPAHPPAHPAHKEAAAPAKPAPAPAAPVVTPPPVTFAPAPPPAASLPPPVIGPQQHVAPTPLAPVVQDAIGQASKITGGIRVTFGAGKADLNPDTSDALHAFARVIAADPAATVNVYAYAAGTPDDPSTPRRLSLSRALAARAILINEGITSTRIYPRAMGATPSDGPPDRVDVTEVGLAPPPAPAAPPNAPPNAAHVTQ